MVMYNHHHSPYSRHHSPHRNQESRHHSTDSADRRSCNCPYQPDSRHRTVLSPAESHPRTSRPRSLMYNHHHSPYSRHHRPHRNQESRHHSTDSADRRSCNCPYQPDSRHRTVLSPAESRPRTSRPRSLMYNHHHSPYSRHHSPHRNQESRHHS